MRGETMTAELYAVVHQLVGAQAGMYLPRPYLAADFGSHPNFEAAVYVFTDVASEVRYVGSVHRIGAAAERRVREHLRDLRKDRRWTYVWFVPFNANSTLQHVRSMERLAGERLNPTDNKRLPGIR